MSSFRIMTFNVKGAYFNDGENNWEHRWPLTIEIIKRHAPDLIGFQEVQTPNQATLAEQLTEYDFELGPDTARENSTGRGYHNAIYWNPQRFDKIRSGSFYLSKTPEVYSRDWDGSEVRGVTWVELRDKQTQQAFLYLNSHFPHDSEWARIEGAKLICGRLGAMCGPSALPVLLSADFNSRASDVTDWGAVRQLPQDLQRWIERAMPPAAQVYQVLMEAGFRDTFYETAHEDASTVNTFHLFKGRDFPPLGYRIDWILTLDGDQRWQTHTCEIITDEAPPLYPSDHYPVLAEVELL